MARVYLLAATIAVCGFLSGCVIQRQITDVWAHDSYNNYKVQTLTTKYAVFSAWNEWEVWTCRHEGAGIRCSKITYDSHQMGKKQPAETVGQAAQAPQPAETAAPTEAAMTPPPSGGSK